MEDAAPGVAQVPKALTRPPGAPEPAGGGRAHAPPDEGREGAADAQVPLGCSPLGGGPPGCPAGRRQVAEVPGADGEGQGAGVLGGG